MNGDALVDQWREALTVMAAVAAPFLVVALAVGLAVATLQTATQLQENLLTFAPKLAATLLVVALGGHWIVDRLTRFATSSFEVAAAPPRPDPDPIAGPITAAGAATPPAGSVAP
ncbi:MAG: flagellar biosynthetic protein FliQ [Kofleriaceae bacterium]